MSTASNNIQVVFLIDVSTCHRIESKWEEAISFCVLRVLSFLNSQLEASDPNKPSSKSLRWGYRLFDINEQIGKLSTREASSGFQGFKLKNYENFERILRNVSHMAGPSSANQQKQTSKAGLAAPSHPAQCLSKRLTEVLHDFSWQLPDVGSPVKKNKGFSTPENESHSNYVFLISRVPCDKKTLRHFCNLVVMDKSVLLESFMPQVLRKQFYAQHKIQLHWIEIGRYLHPEDSKGSIAPDKKCYDMVRHALKVVGGVLVPFHSLVTCTVNSNTLHQRTRGDGYNDSSATHSVSADSLGSDSGLDQVQALLSSFAAMSACSALIPCWSRGKKTGHKKETGDAPITTTLVIQHQGEESHTDVVLKVVPIIKKSCARSQEGPDQQTLKLHTYDHTDSACCLLSNTSSKMSHRSQSLLATRLEMRACMEKTHARRLGSNLGSHFLCILHESATSDQSQTFLALLQSLHSQDLTLVLSVKVGPETSPYLALLEAGSANSAHLSYLSLSLTLQVEKVVTLLGLENHQSQDDGDGTKLQDFINKMANALEAPSAHTEQHRGQDEPSEGDSLWTGALNTWHVPGSVPQLQSTLDTLTNRLPRVARQSKVKKTVLQELKHAYRREKQPPFLQPVQQSTPMLLPTPASFLSRSSIGSLDRSNASREDLSGSEGRPSSAYGGEGMLTRGRMMVKRAISMASVGSVSLEEVDGDLGPSSVTATDSLPSKADSSKADSMASKSEISVADVNTTEELSEFLDEQYRTVLEAGADIEDVVQTMMLVTQNHMISQGFSCPHEKVAEFLKEKVLKTSKEVRSRYLNQTSEDSAKARIAEIKLQVLLHLELVVILNDVDGPEKEEFTEQIVDLLRSVVFGTSTGSVSKFLNDTVLKNYQVTLPNLLVTVYMELTQPLPSSLRPFASPDRPLRPRSVPYSVPTSSVSMDADNSISALGNINPSVESSTNRTRSSLRSHPSLVGLGSKRQILVESKHTEKPQGSKSKKSRNKPKKDCKSPGKQRGEGKKARRSLFTAGDGDGGQSSKTTPRKHSHHTVKTLVAETPHHRQKSRLAWQREQLEKELSVTGTPDVEVIAESPLKDIEQLKSTPGRCKAPRRVLRNAFYSTNREQTSRSWVRALEKPENTTGQQHVIDLRATKVARLSEALPDKDGKLPRSPRSQALALLRGSLQKSPSPGPSSCQRGKGSKTPQRLRQRQLPEDTRSMPAFSSVAKVLDFTTSSSKSSFAVNLESVLTSPVTRARQRLLINTPTKEDFTLTNTPTKPTTASSTHSATAQCRTTPRKGAITPKKGETTTPTKKGKSAVSTPRKSGLGLGEECSAKGVNEATVVHGSSSTAASQQPSILDYVSPSQRPNTRYGTSRDSGDQHYGLSNKMVMNETSRFDIDSVVSDTLITPKRSSRRNLTTALSAMSHAETGELHTTSSVLTPTKFMSEAVPFSPKPRSSHTGTPIKTRQNILNSPVHNSPLLRTQQFMSPTKTPTKSILKMSPTKHQHTPQKSPRVTFGSESIYGGAHNLSNTPTKNNRVKPPNFDKQGQGRKRRHSGEQLPSSFSLCPEGPACDPNMDGVGARKGIALVDDRDTSSPSKRRRTLGSSVKVGISKPTLFSENAMDSYFSASHEGMFLGNSTAAPLSQPPDKSHASTRQASPHFKGKLKGKVCGVEDSQGFHVTASKSSVDSIGGSQGFEIGSSQTVVIQPESPTFSVSPTQKRRTKIAHTSEKEFSRREPTSRTDKPARKTAGTAVTVGLSKTDSQTSERSALDDPGADHLTPLRVQGLVTDKKYSPNVSTNSLQQLMKSPLISKASQEADGESVQSSQDSDFSLSKDANSLHLPRKSRASKKLKM